MINKNIIKRWYYDIVMVIIIKRKIIATITTIEIGQCIQQTILYMCVYWLSIVMAHYNIFEPIHYWTRCMNGWIYIRCLFFYIQHKQFIFIYICVCIYDSYII